MDLVFKFPVASLLSETMQSWGEVRGIRGLPGSADRCVLGMTALGFTFLGVSRERNVARHDTLKHSLVGVRGPMQGAPRPSITLGLEGATRGVCISVKATC